MTTQKVLDIPFVVQVRPPLAPGFWWTKLSTTAAVVWFVALIPHTVAFALSMSLVLRGRQPGNLVDFLAASRAMLRGQDIYASGSLGYVYPPMIAFLYQPLALLSERWAGVVSLTLNAGLSVFTLVLVSRVLVARLVGRFDDLLAARAAVFGAFCTADKIKGEFAHVETNVFMLLAFTAAMRWVDKRPWLCGMALGFAFNIKYLPIVLVPYLALRGRWRAIGWFAVWAVGFGLIPALSMGLTANARAWAQAGGGVLKLFGVNTNVAHTAHVHSITDLISISATSGIARVTGLTSPFPLLIAAGIGLIFCLYAAAIYAQNRLPLYRWPSVPLQARRPYRGLLSIEWIGLLLLTLIFSPFTNSRHLYLLMDVNIAAGILLLAARGVVTRVPLALATAVMAVGITFPPGGIKAALPADTFWRTIGGPAWSMLAMYTVLIWTNVRYQAGRRHDPADSYLTRDRPPGGGQ